MALALANTTIKRGIAGSCLARLIVSAVALLMFLALGAAKAEDVLLTVSNRHLEDTTTVRLTRSDLLELPQARLQTATEWTDGTPVFEGPLARDVIDRLVGHGEKVANAVAVNDYSVEIPVSDFEKYDVVLALRMNGRELSLRDKGPIWIVYPRDQHEELRDPVFNSRWIWQLDRLELR